MSPELHQAIEHAYRVFEPYRPDVSLTVCHCPVCMDEETEQALVQTPLREISSPLLAEYTNSAHGWDDENISREMRWFLPRYLEFIALDDAPDALGLGTCLRRLAEGTWRSTWPAEEVEAVDRYFDALVTFNIGRADVRRTDRHPGDSSQLMELFELIAKAGGDVGRALRTWEAAPDPAAAIKMADARRSVVTENGRHRFHTIWLENLPAESERIGAFLMQLSIARRIMVAAETTGNSRLLDLSPLNFPREGFP